MRYVHVANAHRRTIPEQVIHAAGSENDPDRRILPVVPVPSQSLGGNRSSLRARTRLQDMEQPETDRLQ